MELKNNESEEINVPNAPPAFDDLFYDANNIITLPNENIFIDGYEKGIEHRPVREHHVEKVMSTYHGYTNPMRAVYDEINNIATLSGSQHHLTAVRKLIENGMIDYLKEFQIIPAKRKSTLKFISLDNEEDKELVFKASFNEADSQERNCFADRIFMMKKIGDEFFKKNPGKSHGIIDYIYENQYGATKLSKKTIQQDYRPVVIDTEEACKKLNKNFFKIAQEERWVQKIWDSKLKGYELSNNGRKNFDIRLSVPVDLYRKLKAEGFLNKIEDVDFWNAIMKLPKKNRDEIKKLVGCNIKVK